MISNNPSSFRLPIQLPPDVHPSVSEALRLHDDAITDLQQAIPYLKSTIDSVTSSTTKTSVASGTTSTENVILQSIASSIGNVSNQKGLTTYLTQQSDYGADILLSDASAIAVTLTTGTAITTPWFAAISNYGAGSATLTPQSGTINGNANLVLSAGQWVFVFYDGTNFFANVYSPATGGGGVTQIVAGTNVTISPTGGTGAVTVNATGASGGVTQLVAGSGISLSPTGGTGAVTVTATGGGVGYLKGVVNVVVSGSGTYDGTGTVTGAVVGNPSCCALRGGPNNPPGFPTTLQNILCGVSSADTVTVQLVVPSGISTSGTVVFDVAVFP